jgi:predicted nucleotidyltransferase
MNEADVLRRMTGALEQAGISFMLVGSFAATFYSEPRATQDIDIVIAAAPSQLKTLISLLPAEEYYSDLDAAIEANKRQSMFNVIDSASGWKIDFIICKSRAFDVGAFRRRVPVQFEGISLFIASVEDTILSKLEWAKLAGSARQIEHVASILRVRSDSLDRAYLDQWIRELEVTKEWEDAGSAAGIADL